MAAPILGRRPQLSEEVAGHLRAQIMSGVLRPGRFVRMDETAAMLGVSVTPVREALVTLRGEGLVEQVPHRGYRVGELRREDVDDIFWLQGTIASKLARRAARAASHTDVDELTRLNEALRRAVALGIAESVEACEFEFHRYVNRLAGGAKLAWFLLAAVRYTPARLYAADPEWGVGAVRSHEVLVDAVRRGDVETAGEEMRRQFADGAARLIAHLELVGVWE